MEPGPPGETRAERIEALFHELLERPVDAREQRLAEVSAADPAIAERVRALLAAAAEADGFLTALPGRLAASRDADQVAELSGRRVGAYAIDGLIGRGGMGAVYRAHRADEHFEKAVAIKLVPVGLVSASARTRFQHERQTLARLDHPNIARLLDGGVLDDATPYLVMELVEGQPIDQWCEARRLPVRARVELMLRVLDAVQHAHQSLVLHSDLKPDNVLVSDTGVPKLIDFGIARSLANEGGESTLTRKASPLTPAYASPEQWRGDVLTTASGVHALGALLYALLAGRPPFESAGRSAAELERIVNEETPPPPSQVAPPERAGALRGDLDTIVLKALQKLPARRYASAGAMADDLRAHLEGRPISARRDSARYVFSRFVRRHRAAVATVSAAVAVALGVAVAFALFSAKSAREIALERDRVRHEARTAEAVADFLATLYDGADPDVSGGQPLTAHELLDRSASRLGADLAGQPEVEARMASILAALYEKLGRYDDAFAMAQRAASLHAAFPGADPLKHADALESEAKILRDLMQLDSAETVLGQAERLRRARLDADSVALAPVLAARAALAADRNQPAEADSLLLAAERLMWRASRPDTAILAEVARQRAYLATYWGSPADAESLCARAAALFRATLGPAHSQVAITDREHAAALLRLDRNAEAESLLVSARARLAASFGRDHDAVLIADEYLGTALYRLGRPAEGRAHLMHALAERERRFGPDDPRVVTMLNAIGLLHREVGDDREALDWLRRAAEGYRRLGPGAATNAQIVQGNIANTLLTAHRYREAEPVLRDLRAQLLANPARATTQLVLCDFGLARVRHGLGDVAGAETAYRRARAEMLALGGGSETSLVPGLDLHLGRLLLQTKRAAEADTLLRGAVETLALNRGPDATGTAYGRILRGAALSQLGRLAQADTMIARALAVQRRQLVPASGMRQECEQLADAHAARVAARR